MTMKLLVTGGCGFIGSHFIRRILETYPTYSVTNLDALTYAGNPSNLADCADNPRYAFVRGSIADRPLVERVCSQGFDAVINYAAETHVDRSILDAGSFVTTDVLGTHTILEAVKKFGIPRFIQISTDEVFGSTREGEFYEDSPFEPNSPYSASKAGADLLCRAYAHTYGLPVVVTHACNVYGPNQYPEKIIPLFATNLLEGKKVPLYGTGENVREWLFVTDHAAAIDLILHSERPEAVYNIGSGHRVSNIELTAAILDLCGVGQDMIEPVADRPGHDARYAINADKLKALGWRAAVEFGEGLRRTVEWYRLNEAWWRPLKSGEYRTYYEQNYAARQSR